MTALRLKASNQWTENSLGHTIILNQFRSIPSNTDYATPNLVFENNFQVTIPSRSAWDNKEFLQDKSIHFFTDGSKTREGVGGGVYSKQLKINHSFRLPDHCSVFQAEVLAIKEVLSWLKENVVSNTDIRIFSDSQAALKALSSVSNSSLTTQNCRSSLTEMAKQFNIHLVWVPGHRDIDGNCRADELARIGTSIPILLDKADIGIPIATCKLMLNNEAYEKANDRWSNINSCTATKRLWDRIDYKRSKSLLSLSRMNISSVVNVITGHCPFGRHATRMGIISNDFCRSCLDEEEEESIQHLLCDCPALSNRRKTHLGNYFFDDISDLKNISIMHLNRFIRSSNWFNP